MLTIQVRQPNGKIWWVTQCEVVIPNGGTEGMSPPKVIETLGYCEKLSRRFSDYLLISGSYKDSFVSVEEFEHYERNPTLARAEFSSKKEQRKPQPGFVYLARGNGSFKIGRSRDLVSREHYLTTKLPFSVEVVHTIIAKDCVQTERFWHERFAAKHVRG